MTSSQKAHELHEKILTLLLGSSMNNLGLGEVFYQIQKEKLYKDLVGDRKATFSDYLHTPEIKKTYQYAYVLIEIYKKYIIELGLTYEKLRGIDTLSLFKVRKVIDKKNKDEWIAQLETLSRSDINRLLKYGDKNPMSCEHKWEIVPPKYKCLLCGEITKHNPNENTLTKN